MASKNLHRFRDNDIIVVGNNGLFNNIYSKSIIKCLESELEVSDIKLPLFRMEDVSQCIENYSNT